MAGAQPSEAKPGSGSICFLSVLADSQRSTLPGRGQPLKPPFPRSPLTHRGDSARFHVHSAARAAYAEVAAWLWQSLAAHRAKPLDSWRHFVLAPVRTPQLSRLVFHHLVASEAPCERRNQLQLRSVSIDNQSSQFSMVLSHQGLHLLAGSVMVRAQLPYRPETLLLQSVSLPGLSWVVCAGGWTCSAFVALHH